MNKVILLSNRPILGQFLASGGQTIVGIWLKKTYSRFHTLPELLSSIVRGRILHRSLKFEDWGCCVSLTFLPSPVLVSRI